MKGCELGCRYLCAVTPGKMLVLHGVAPVAVYDDQLQVNAFQASKSRYAHQMEACKEQRRFNTDVTET